MSEIDKPHLNPLDLNVLEQVAKLADGQWRHTSNNTVLDVNGWVVASCEGNPDTARFIATFDGPTVRDLVKLAKVGQEALNNSGKVPEPEDLSPPEDDSSDES